MGDCRDGTRKCRCVHMLKGSEAERSKKRGGTAESNRERSLTSRGWLGDRMGRIWQWIENLGTATRCMVWQRMSVNSVGEIVVPCETPARFPYPHPPHVPCLANPPHYTYVTFFPFLSLDYRIYRSRSSTPRADLSNAVLMSRMYCILLDIYRRYMLYT